MKIVTWNINGIRSTGQPLKDVLDSLAADIICLQETKVTRDQLESEIAIIEGYNSYFSFSLTKTGYSGVATYCKNSYTPTHAQTGLTNLFETTAGKGSIGSYGRQTELFSNSRLEELDKEGRAVITQHSFRENEVYNTITIINVYCPRADPEKEDRRKFKLDFYKLLEERSKALLCKTSAVVIVGDVNTSHRQIDHCDPHDPIIFYDNPARAWMDSFLFGGGDYSLLQKEELQPPIDSGMFVDTFRYFYPKKQDMFTCWCTSNRARQTNYGTRIDYVLVDKHFIHKAVACEIMSDFHGSDHCPVIAEFEAKILPANECPPLCSKFSEEFVGKQQKLSSYFSKTQPSSKIMPGNKEIQDSLGKIPKLNKKGPSQTTMKNFFKSNNNDLKAVAAKMEPIAIVKSGVPNTSANMSAFWKSVLKGPGPAPLCRRHQEPCVLRTVKKKGPNLGKQFYCCGRPEGLRSNPDANCQHFEWKK